MQSQRHAIRELEKLVADLIDAGDFYSNPVAKSDRSLMNVPFRLRDAALDVDRVAAATEGFLLGIPSIAFSLAGRGHQHLDTAARVARDFAFMRSCAARFSAARFSFSSF